MKNLETRRSRREVHNLELYRQLKHRFSKFHFEIVILLNVTSAELDRIGNEKANLNGNSSRKVKTIKVTAWLMKLSWRSFNYLFMVYNFNIRYCFPKPWKWKACGVKRTKQPFLIQYFQMESAFRAKKPLVLLNCQFIFSLYARHSSKNIKANGKGFEHVSFCNTYFFHQSFRFDLCHRHVFKTTLA